MLSEWLLIREWCERAPRTRHPLLRARYADLAWEIARFRRAELSVRAAVAMARMAIVGYLDAVERRLTPEDLCAWNYIERAIELAARISDTARMQRAKHTAVFFNLGCGYDQTLDASDGHRLAQR